MGYAALQTMFKKIAIGLGGVALITAVALFVLYRRVTALPEWAQDEVAQQEAMDPDAPIQWEAETRGAEALPPEIAEALPPEPPPPAPAPGEPIGEPAPPKRTAEPERYVLRGFHRRGKGTGKDAVRASKAVLENGRLEAGVVLDLSRIEDAKMSDSDRGLYEGALQAFPPLRSKNVYVGVETRPVRKGDVLQLGKTAKLRIGKVRYDLGAAASKLGMSEDGLRRALDQNMRKLGFKAPRK